MSRCTEKSTMWLLDEYGKRVPGGAMCATHGEAVLLEYQVKIGLEWSSERIDPARIGRCNHWKEGDT